VLYGISGGFVPFSMTGFGAAEGPAAGGRLRVEIRTVNHRFFNLSAKLPGDLSALENELRERLRKDFERGHVTVSVRWLEIANRDGGLALNLERARSVVARLRELQTNLGLAGEVSLELVARAPEVLTTEFTEAAAANWAELEPIVGIAASECKAMRRREGEVLVSELRHRLDLLDQACRVVGGRAPERLLRERDRLRAAVGELLSGKALDENRIAQEIAFLAEKLDITEELVRFTAHLQACREALSADRPAGKQLGFLAQELGREVNTMGAKANDAEIAQQVILMKGELEKFREQLENLE
jgi:uncharacterized protein (TIGR00255 family)